MAPLTAVCLLFCGLAAALLHAQPQWLRRAAPSLAIAAGVTAYVTLLGYLFGAIELSRIGSLPPISLISALSIVALAAGLLLSRPGYGVMATILSGHDGGHMVRRMLPFAIVLPVVLGWLRLLGQRAGWYDTEVGLAALVTANVMVFSGAIAVAARSLNRSDAQRRNVEALSEGQKRVLEMIARGAPLHETLDALVRFIDAQSDDIACSILLLEPDTGRLRAGAAPRLPRAYTEAIDGRQIGPSAGSCGTAAYRGVRVFVEDIATDPLWDAYKDLALPHGLRACWSTPILDPDRKVLGTFAIYYNKPGLPNKDQLLAVDIATYTAAICINRHEVEEERKQSEDVRIRSQKVEAMGTLAGGIAHDFNNILLAINGHTRVLEEELPARHAARESLAEIAKATARAADLVRRILAFSRQQDTKHEIIALRPIVEEALKLMRATLPAMVEIRASLWNSAPPVAADSGQIHQIVVNLTTNAAYAIGTRGGVIEVKLDTLEVDSDLAETLRNLPPGRYVRLVIADNGCGMDRATLGRIFDPFFTTKPAGQGTGLGLSIVHGIMNSCHGAVTVYSQPDKGTSFHLYFPAAAGKVESQPAPAAKLASAHGERVMYVDDEEPLVRLAKRVLTRLGYLVTGHTDPVQALEEFRDRPGDFDVIITDVSMPSLSGFDLTREALAIRPDLPVIMTSGYVRKEDEEAAQQLGVREIILKPNTLDELGKALQRLFANAKSKELI
jgi:signal transduction histidine kinase/ActR/RegA family two-component response regulator